MEPTVFRDKDSHPPSHELDNGVVRPACDGIEEPQGSTRFTKRRNMSQLSWICLLISLLSSMFLFALDNTVVADAQPRIIETFGHVKLLPWISVAYALGAIALNLFLSVRYWPVSIQRLTAM